MSQLTNDDVIKYLMQLGIGNVYGQMRALPMPTAVNDAVANPTTLTAAQSGQVFRCVVDAVITLPLMAATLRGVWYKIQCGAVSSGVGLSISPNAADGIGGAGLTSVVDKDLVNTGATDVLDDYVILEATGVPGTGAWVIRDICGIWAKAS